MMLPLSLALITLFACGADSFKISKQQSGCSQCSQLEGQQQQIPGNLGEQLPQTQSQWDLRAGQQQEYSQLQQDYYYNRPSYTQSTAAYFARPALNYEKEELPAGGTKGPAYLEREPIREPIRQPQYSPYAGQQLALVLIRPLQFSAGQQLQYPLQEPYAANLFMQAPPQPGRPEQLPLPPPNEQQPLQPQPQQFGAGYAGYQGGPQGGVFAKSHEKLAKLKSHLERFAAEAKAKLGSTYHYNGEETLPGPPQGLPLPPSPRPQFVAAARPTLVQQVQQQGQLEMSDIKLTKQEQEKIRDAQQQQQQPLQQQQQEEKVEQEEQEKQTAVKQELPAAGQEPIASGAAAKATAPGANQDGFARRQSSLGKQIL